MVEIYGYSIATIPAIATGVYGIIEILKNFVFKNNSNFRKFIPIVAACVGGIISLITYIICPELIPVGAWYSAIIVGGASGLSAVGINQIKKQITNKEGNNNVTNS